MRDARRSAPTASGCASPSGPGPAPSPRPTARHDPSWTGRGLHLPAQGRSLGRLGPHRLREWSPHPQARPGAQPRRGQGQARQGPAAPGREPAHPRPAHEARALPADLARRGRQADHPLLDVQELRRDRPKAPHPGPRAHPAREAHARPMSRPSSTRSRRRACRLAGSSTATPSCGGPSDEPSAGAWSAATSPSSSTPPRVPRHEISPLTPEQARRLIETSAKDRYRGLWITALGTGLRQGELLGLRWEDVDLEAGRLRVRHTLGNVEGTLTLLEPKTDRSRRLVVLPAVVVEALRAHRTRQKMDRLVAGSRWTDSGHVFATMLGRPHHAATITRAFQDALDRAEPARTSASTTCATRRRRSSCPRASRSRTSSSSSGTRRSS